MARSVWKGPFVELSLLKKAEAAQDKGGRAPIKTFKAELMCIVDSLDAGMLVRRTESSAWALPPVKLMHGAKERFEAWYLRRYR